MGEIRKQGLQNTAVSYTGILIGFVNAVLLFPNLLQEEELGLTRIFIQSAMLLIQFSTLGLKFSIVKYFPKFQTEDNRHNSFLPIFSLVSIIGIVASIALVLLFRSPIEDLYSDRSPLFSSYFILILPLGASFHFFYVFAAWSKALLKTVFPNFLQEVMLRLLQTASILAYYFELVDFDWFVACFVGSYTVILLILVIKLFLDGLMPLQFSSDDLKREKIYPFIRHSLFSMLGGITNTLTLTFDGLMISAMIGLGENGIYSTAVYLTSLILVPSKVFFRVTGPVIAKYWNEGKQAGINNLYKNVTLINTIAGGVIFSLIWASIDDLYTFMPKSFAVGISVFLIYGVGRLFELIGGINGTILINSPKYIYETIINIMFCILMVVLNIILIPQMGLNGAALATLISLLVLNVSRSIVLYSFFGFLPFHPKLILAFILGLGIVFLGHQLPDLFSPIPNILYKSVAIGCLSLVAIYFSGLFKTIMSFSEKKNKEE